MHYRSWINLVSIVSNKILLFINVHRYFIFRMKFVLRNVGMKLPRNEPEERGSWRSFAAEA